MCASLPPMRQPSKDGTCRCKSNRNKCACSDTHRWVLGKKPTDASLPDRHTLWAKEISEHDTYTSGSKKSTPTSVWRVSNSPLEWYEDTECRWRIVRKNYLQSSIQISLLHYCWILLCSGIEHLNEFLWIWRSRYQGDLPPLSAKMTRDIDALYWEQTYRNYNSRVQGRYSIRMSRTKNGL